MSRVERRLRLASGLVLASYVTGHLLNHALGIVSFDAMEALRRPLAAWWRSAPGTALLYGSLLAHFAVALVSLGRRRTLRLPAWEALQLALGLAVPLLLAYHIAGTRFLWQALGREVDYPRIVWAIWSDPVQTAKQIGLIAAVWLHLCFGIHFWLRIRPWYPRAQPWLLGAAVLVPALALAGFVSAGANASPPPPQPLSPGEHAFLLDVRDAIWWTFGLGLGAVLAFRVARALRQRSYRIHHSSGRVIVASVGASVLEALRDARIPHASVCGGRARCTTCRVRIGGAAHALSPPAPLEAEALERIGAAPNVRLACQLRPSRDVHITPLVPPGNGLAAARRPGGVQGHEQTVVAMFVDLRGSTALAEARLPYDVVFILNQFFAEMSEALAATGGHYAQFSGDGLLALYGLEGDLGPACRAALAGAANMKRRLATLNAHLAPELGAPLRIGIGIHVGTAIVGTMGPPAAPTVTAIGDTVNTAARLEALTKEFGAMLVVSVDTLRYAGIAAPDAPVHRVEVRGKTTSLEVVAVGDPQALLAAAPRR
ncbi:MAG: adenylate/guanylate cyclase domain-containing protein [Burkholderiales bacterium]|nr:adenylate/guanylate cyclase domain-containing protein [Burkholderiales bacterium]